METWKILLITLLSAVIIGCVAGVVIGKHQLKVAKSGYKPLLSMKERIIYLSCIAAGAACILVGVFQPFSSPEAADTMGEGMTMEEGFFEGEDGLFDGDFAVENEQPGGSDGEDEGISGETDEENPDGYAGDEEDSDSEADTDPSEASQAGEEDADANPPATAGDGDGEEAAQEAL